MKPVVNLDKLFFPFIPMYHKKTAHCASKAIKLWLRAGQQRLKPLMPHSHQQEQRALPTWPLGLHVAALPRQKPDAKSMPETELYSPGKICPLGNMINIQHPQETAPYGQETRISK